MSEATQVQTINEINKTDFGHFIYENRKAFFALVVVLAVAVLGFIGWKQVRESSNLENSVQVFEFEKKTWDEAKAGKITPQDLVTKFTALPADVQKAPVMIPMALEMGKFLFDKGNYTEADQILSKLDTTNNHLAKFFVGLQRYVILEKLGKTDEAIAVLEDKLMQEIGFMDAFVGVELGRLYLTKGEKGKAQTAFDNVISKFPNDEHAKLAKLYLAEMKK